MLLLPPVTLLVNRKCRYPLSLWEARHIDVSNAESKSKLDDACGKNSAWKAGGISVQHENLPWNPPGLPHDCRDSKLEGKYRYITRSEQPSAHTSDEMDRWCGIPRDSWQPSGTRKVHCC